ncbi:MAG TPA: hypothetical protein VFI88_07115 [Sphingomicrobium sp.]|jgi:hypothetical protein|nr:hypothetical protein [Sphingomicrobium sp.]
MRIPLISLAILTLIACSSRDPVADDATNVDALPVANVPSASPSGGPPSNSTAVAPPAEVAPESAIPAALHGRWGLGPGDCTSTRGDAKGLLIVGPDGLRFYESRAVPSPGIQTSPNSVSGNFAFTGEGQEWTKYETLERRGDKLVRTERDPNVSFTYIRCDS